MDHAIPFFCFLCVVPSIHRADKVAGDATDAFKRNVLPTLFLWGVYPYINCAQVWDAAPSTAKIWSHPQRFVKRKGDRTNRTPVKGDIIVFTDDQVSRSHTGMVTGCDGTYVYTIEGNSANRCQRRSYKLTDKYIYGWVHPNYAKSSDPTPTSGDKYGAKMSVTMHVLSKGFTVTRRFRGATYRIRVENPNGVEHGVCRLTVNGMPVEGLCIPPAPEGAEVDVTAVMG